MQLSPALQSPFSFHLGCGYDARKKKKKYALPGQTTRGQFTPKRTVLGTIYLEVTCPRTFYFGMHGSGRGRGMRGYRLGTPTSKQMTSAATVTLDGRRSLLQKQEE